MRVEIKDGLTKTQTTFFEFVEATNKEGIRHRESDVKSSGRCSFFGSMKNYKDMYDACYSGMGVKKMLKAKANISNLVNHEIEQPRKAIVGETLNVGAYCSGNPYHFYKDADEYGKPRVHIVYSTNAVAGVKASEFTRHGASICALVDQLADQVDVKISLYITNRGVFTGKGCQIVTIKDYDETIDVARVSATAHPSFFRRIGFTWFENADTLIDPACRSGYGGSMTGKHRNRVIDNDEFDEWIGTAEDELVIDFPAPDEYQFGCDEQTATWMKNAVIPKIEKSIDEKKSRVVVYGLDY